MSKGPVSIGAILLIAGIADHAYAAPKAALCGSSIGEFGQALDPSLGKDCSTYTTMEHFTGWLIGGGIALLAIGVIWFIVAAGMIGAEANRKRKSRGSATSPQTRPTAARTAAAQKAPAGPAPASYGTSAPFATPTPFATPAPFEAPAPFGTSGQPQDPNIRG
jgi:hypothetical protein